jgi:WD40 repeat protein
VHGISVYSESYDDVIKLVIWGGCLVRALEINSSSNKDHQNLHLDFFLSAVAKSPDWILDLAPRFSSLEDEVDSQQGVCVAVTAHNALVQVAIHRQNEALDAQRYVIHKFPAPHIILAKAVFSVFSLSITELTSGSRSILYSAHVFWESQNCVLVAAGTAFGEIMYWSWNNDSETGATSCIHRVFLGHEGSIFGVRISKQLPTDCCQSLRRIIASCSDDRTIRIWDVSDVAIYDRPTAPSDQNSASERTRHTGFSNAAVDPSSFASSQCLAIGWGHTSRVWDVQFLESTPCEGALLLVSAGEDAFSRTWKLSPDKTEGTMLPYKLIQQDSAAHHSGKNIWANSISGEPVGRQQIVCGAADSKITAHPLVGISEKEGENRVREYTVPDILSLAQTTTQETDLSTPQDSHKSSKKAEFFRSYCFLDSESFLLTTNSGKIFIATLQFQSGHHGPGGLSQATLIDQRSDLSGYSVCTGETTAYVAFVAGSTGTVYMYNKSSNRLTNIGFVDAKIGEMFATSVLQADGSNVVALLVTLVGREEARLIYVDPTVEGNASITQTFIVPLSELPSGSMITSMALTTTTQGGFVHLGFRKGSIAVYSVSAGTSNNSRASLVASKEKVHGDETVTALHWTATAQYDFVGYLISVGRDGCLAVHLADLQSNTLELVHNLTLPIGPNIEGIYFNRGHLLVHGFSSKRWVLYDVTIEDEIMGVETGGAHRSWAFQLNPESPSGGTLVWTRASSMHIRSQRGPNHSVIRSGGHGREIKAVAVAQGPCGQLIATGAEDTDIKIFEYIDGELHCTRTLRRHTTGIQHLQWSADGNYLFSSGGCEEFYIWRIRPLPSGMGIGIVYEFAYTPESEHADLRIMSFDVQETGTGYDIAMVFSDSSIKVKSLGEIFAAYSTDMRNQVYQYRPLSEIKWQPFAQGLYFTSCLTQCLFLSNGKLLTAGTDGHTAVWSLACDGTQPAKDSQISTLAWQLPIRIHQSASKAMDSCRLDRSTKLIVSGGDDGSMTILLTSTSSSLPTYQAAPVLLQRTHASAVTACAILTHKTRTLVATSGNDQWLRLWEIDIRDNQENDATKHKKRIDIRRLGKIKTNVADVSSMALLTWDDGGDARVVICGVGMEVVRVRWDD